MKTENNRNTFFKGISNLKYRQTNTLPYNTSYNLFFQSYKISNRIYLHFASMKSRIIHSLFDVFRALIPYLRSGKLVLSASFPLFSEGKALLPNGNVSDRGAVG